jgi:hypothetical protein
MTARWIWNDRPMVARLFWRKRVIVIVDRQRFRYHTLRLRAA